MKNWAKRDFEEQSKNVRGEELIESNQISTIISIAGKKAEERMKTIGFLKYLSEKIYENKCRQMETSGELLSKTILNFGTCDGEKTNKGIEDLFDKIIAEKFPTFGKVRVNRIPITNDKKRLSLSHMGPNSQKYNTSRKSSDLYEKILNHLQQNSYNTDS